MNKKHVCHHPLHCVVPPHMLRALAANGTPKQKERALAGLKLSGQFRGERQQVAEMTLRHRTRAAATGKNRIVYDAENKQQLPGRKVRGEGDSSTGDVAADEAYDGAGDTYDLYQEVYQRNSIDDEGLDLISTVHFGEGYDNAFWNGEQMSYGDGDEDLPEDERLFNRFTISLDIIGHELTHGVTQFEAGLVYRNQPGALNESMSDVFGALVTQYKLKQSAEEADWLIGGGLFTENVNAQAIRSMKAPGTAYDDPRLGKDPQPAHMNDIYTGFDDNGGVHINSGIANHAFYVTAMEIGGNAWEKAGHIWYIALRDKLGSSTDFCNGAKIFAQVAGELYGEGSTEQEAVRKGWDAVGIDISQPCTPPRMPQGCMMAPVTVLGALGSYLSMRGGDI